MAKNDQITEAVDVQTERKANQALSSSTLVSQSQPAQVERTEITQIISTSGVSSAAGTANQVSVNGGTGAATGAVTFSLPATITVTTAYQISGTQIVGSRKTGWTAWTGTNDRTSHATYSGTASAGYVQAELQAVMDSLKQVTEAYKALLADLTLHGLVGT
jgi:hypothetical protein